MTTNKNAIEIFNEIKALKKGTSYAVSGTSRFQVGLCHDGKTLIIAHIVMPEWLMYKNTYEDRMYTKKNGLEKVKSLLKIAA